MMRIHSIVFLGFFLFSFRLTTVGWSQTKPGSVSATQPVSLSIEGNVVDAATYKAIPGAIVSAKSQSGASSDQKRVGADGTFKLILRSKEAFELSVNANGYEPFVQQMAGTSTYTDKILGKTIALAKPGAAPMHTNASTVVANTSAATTPSLPAPIVTTRPAAGSSAVTITERVTPPKTLDAKVIYTPPLVVAPTGKTTQLRAIQFVQSKAELLPDATPVLEQILAFLREHPAVEIELAGHTDNQGDFDQNLLLSKQRVEVVKDYLVQNGIASNRISTRGYGPTRPIASNKSEATRQLNRRVEMIVVKQ